MPSWIKPMMALLYSKNKKNWRECVGIEPTQEALNPSY